MNSLAWTLICVALLGTAVTATVSLRKSMKTQLPAFEETTDTTKPPPATTTAPSPRQTAAQPSRAADSQDSLDDIWQKSLFRPDRTEEIAQDEPSKEDAIDQRQANSEFELVGIAQIGEPGAATPIAIIRQRGNTPAAQRAPRPGGPPGSNQPRGFQPGARMRPGMPSNFPRNMPPGGFGPQPGMMGPAPEEPAAATAETRLKTTFKVGDSVNKTGYVLSAIDVAANSVTLTRNGEELVLTIILGDAQSIQRKEVAVANAETLRRERENAAQGNNNQQQNQPGMPPFWNNGRGRFQRGNWPGGNMTPEQINAWRNRMNNGFQPGGFQPGGGQNAPNSGQPSGNRPNGGGFPPGPPMIPGS